MDEDILGIPFISMTPKLSNQAKIWAPQQNRPTTTWCHDVSPMKNSISFSKMKMRPAYLMLQ